MIAFLSRLNDKTMRLPKACDSSTLRWHFRQRLSEREVDFFRPFLENGSALNVEYTALCTRLAQIIQSKKDIKDHFDSIISALMMAELLDVLAQHFNYILHDAQQLQREKIVFRGWLMSQGYSFSDDRQTNALTSQPNPLVKRIQEETVNWNIGRVLAQRGRRLLVIFGVHFSGVESLKRWVQWVDQYANPFVRYLTWLFFLPRLLVHLFSMIKDTVPGYWMTSQQKELGVWMRFCLQFEKRAFEFGIDMAWVVVGLMNCFVFTGALLPLALYASIMLQSYDVLLLSMKSSVRLLPWQELLAHYQDLLVKTPNRLSPEAMALSLHCKYLQHHLDYERKKMLLSITNSSIILLSLMFAIPALALTPMMPLLGALLAVVNTVVFYNLDKKLVDTKPSTSFKAIQALESEKASSSVSRLGMFAAETTQAREDKQSHAGNFFGAFPDNRA